MRRVTIVLFVTVFVMQGAWAVYTQSAKPPGPLRTEKVTGDLYMVSGEGGNVALYVTSEGVVLVDDMFDRNHADILAQVKSVTNQPLRYVINTHQHDDHAGGDTKMLPIAEVIAHRNVRANLKDLKQPVLRRHSGHADRAATGHVFRRARGEPRWQRSAGSLFWPWAHQRRRGHLFS